MRLDFLVDILRSPRAVFDVVGNLENDPKWQSAVLHAAKLTDGPVDMGTRFRHLFQVAGHKMEVDYEFIDYAAPRQYALHCSWGRLSFRTSVLFEPIAKGTRDSGVIEGHVRGALNVALVALSRRRRREIEADLQNLKRLMESRAL